MTDHIETHKFAEFAPALTFLQEQTRTGLHAIYFPRGGDNPRKLVTDPVTHVVIVLKEGTK